MKNINDEIELLDILCGKNNIKLTEKVKGKFLLYLRLLLDWNKRVSLISKNDENRIIERHFFESIILTKFIDKNSTKNFLDFGSGGGFPGIPIKIVIPELKGMLLEARKNKCLFLSKVIKELKIDGVDVLHGRGEVISKNKEYAHKFDIILSRAVYKLDKLIEVCINFFSNNKKAVMIFPKAPDFSKELETVKNKYCKILKLEHQKIFYKTTENIDKELNLVKVFNK
ncbi:16S rRNA (guanine(527)-N(7))-methyltransferase RsmG [candidate division KSB1 bacterium]|nr:MAG: 16S rRNA (guanine(527)-N(7))-methyltransferase RsmG [candidate division KSB1 bacterium]